MVTHGYVYVGGLWWGGWLVTDMFEIAKPLVTGVAKDDKIAVNSRDYTALTGGQDPEPVAGDGGRRIADKETTHTVKLRYGSPLPPVQQQKEQLLNEAQYVGSCAPQMVNF